MSQPPDNVLPFPPQGVQCKVCGFIIVLRVNEDPPADGKCFCCAHGIPLFQPPTAFAPVPPEKTGK